MLRWPRPERGLNVAERNVPPIRSRKNFLGRRQLPEGLLPFIRGSQVAVEKFGGGAVGADPTAPAEQVVNLAWRRVEPLNCSAFADRPSRKATACREATPKAFASGRARQVKRYIGRHFSFAVWTDFMPGEYHVEEN